MYSQKQYFDKLEIIFSKTRGYQLYAVDEESRKEFIDFQSVNIYVTDANEVELKVDQYFPLTFRKKFKNREEAQEQEAKLYKIIKEIEFYELSIYSPNSRINRKNF